MKEEQAQRWEIHEAEPKIVQSFLTQRRAHLADSLVQAAVSYPTYWSGLILPVSPLAFAGDLEPSLLLSF